MRKLALYKPYPKVKKFHDLGLTKRERVLLAGNQLGKTYGAANEMSFHLTGLYPDWWEGKRFVRPISACAANTNNETVRDNPQRLLLGKSGEWGTGTIPRSCVAKKPTMSRGFPDLVDIIQVKHKSGGVSTCQFKAYDQGRKSFQGYTWDAIWCDEEPPEDVYTEILARITATGGIIFMTMTPLLGMSERRGRVASRC
jgi:phage terminase large subunit-like protein